MFKKILAFVLLSIIVSCGSKKPQIQTTKAGVVKNKTTRKSRTAKTKTATVNSKTENRGSEMLESTSKTMVYSDQVKEYISKYDYVAKSNMKKHGIPASIILAQGILESGAGRGTLCVNANNHFGIKCHNDWGGDKVYHDDDSAQECFRKYKLAAESFDDHSLFLTSRGRYANLFKLEKDDYKGWARGLRAAGYATDPKYPEKLIGLIERYELAKYDAEVLGGKYTPVTKDVVIPAKVPAVVSTPKPTPTVKPVPAPAPSIQQGANAASSNDAIATYTVLKGDTLYSISKKNNVTVDQLIQLNGLSGNAIAIGQVLKLK
jgi:flagellum-specific peptidoglycan hydrolase FlgJ